MPWLFAGGALILTPACSVPEESKCINECAFCMSTQQYHNCSMSNVSPAVALQAMSIGPL
jgi:hypothetical protein